MYNQLVVANYLARPWLAFVCAALAFSACLGNPPAKESAADPEPLAPLPAPFQVLRTWDDLAAAGPSRGCNVTPEPCFDFPFDLARPGAVTAHLSWQDAAGGLLYMRLKLRQGEGIHVQRVNEVASTSINFTRNLHQPATYTVTVQAMAPFTLDVTFHEIDPKPSALQAASYVPIDASRLSPRSHTVLPPVETRVQAHDGISLFAEVSLPSGTGPWPVLLHSTPYKHEGNAQMAPAAVTGVPFHETQAVVERYVPRGYAVVVADVRGFNDSEGCVEVWGKNEQRDQYDLVEWAANQPWSNGNVGMIGLSYPGTTPIEAAIQTPPHLRTIVVAAGLTDPYYDWHYGGVPNGESSDSAIDYSRIGLVPPMEPISNPLAWAQSVASSGCGSVELLQDAWRQDSVYSDFYKERNFSAHAKNIRASVLYSQGFTDPQVKPSQLLNFFNAVEAPKKGFFGPWGHVYPTRGDYQDFELAWFDQWLKGVDTGVLRGPTVEVVTSAGTWRGDEAFPALEPPITTIHLDASDGSMRWEPPANAASAKFVADRRTANERLVFGSDPLGEPLFVSGVIDFAFSASMDAGNAYIMGALFEVNGTQRSQIAFGGLSAALRDGVIEYKPVPPGQALAYNLRMMPTEHLVQAGSRLELEIFTLDVQTTGTTEAIGPVTVSFETGPDASTFLRVPTVFGGPGAGRPDHFTSSGSSSQ